MVPSRRPRGLQALSIGPAVLDAVSRKMQLGRWRRLSRCFEQTQMSAEAWLRVAAFGYLLGRV
jgi:hypothetical protein